MKHLYAILGVLGSICLFYGGFVVADNSPPGADIFPVLIVFAMWVASVILLIITISVYLSSTLGKKFGIVPTIIMVFLVIIYGHRLYDYYKPPEEPPVTSESSELELVPIVIAEKLGGVPPISRSGDEVEASQSESAERVVSIEELRAELPEDVIIEVDMSSKELEAAIPQGEAIELLKVSRSRHYYESPRFYIRSVDGLTGYMSGSKICASTAWVNGLSKPCASFSQKDINAPVKLGKTTDSHIELIHRTYAHLPGVWYAEEDYGKDEAKVLVFGNSANDKQIRNQIKYPAQYKPVFPEFRLHITESADRIFFITSNIQSGEWVQFHIINIDS